MTRPEVRVVTDFKNLYTSEYYVSMPQVQDNHNVRFKAQYVEGCDDEEVKRRDEVERENEKQQHFDNVEEIMRVLGRIDEKNSSCSYAVPLFTKLFQGWDMIQSPTHGVEIVGRWKELLLGKDSFDNSYLYTQLVVDVVYPAVRVTSTNNWHVQDAEPLLKFLESWHELLPTHVLQMILDNIVFPKLLAAVRTWDPINEVVPIDCWIHPWLPLLGDKLEESCYQTIHDGFARMLRVWKPADMSAYYALSPWKNVVGSATWEKLIVRYVVPKLMSYMEGFEVNRVEHKLDQFHWASVIPSHHMLQIMDVFFNKWQEVLNQWLRDSPNFGEVRRWYLGWKEELPPELEDAEYIQYRLSIGLMMMDMAVQGMEVAPPRIKKNTNHLRKRKRSALINGIHAEEVSNGLEMSLKEAVEFYAQQNGLLFTPKFGRTKDGLQIYGFGNISVVIDSHNQKVFARIENGSSPWSLVSLEVTSPCWFLADS